MKKMLLLAMIVAAAIGCKRKLSRDDVENQLKLAMYRTLTTGPRFDSSKTRFEVKSVIFFEDKIYYDCQFTVRMKLSSGFDTTGIMAARISKNFEEVKRKY